MARVLLVGKGPPDVGGIPTFLQMLQSSSNGRHQVSFLNVAHHGTPEAGRITQGNVLRTCRDTWSVWREARKSDIVHIHSALTPAVTVLRAGMFAAAARAGGCAVLVHAHGGNLQSWVSSRKARLTLKASMIPAQRVIAVWQVGAVALTQILGKHRVRLIDNGVDTLRFSPSSTGPSAAVPTVLYVGLLTPRKGLVDLLESSRLLTERGVKHQLVLVGGTPDEGPQARDEVLSAAEGVAEIRGHVPSSGMPSLMQSADVFCLPSWWEAMPLSLLEAMASGLPAVTTNVGDTSRAVENGVNGFLVPPHNPGELADALERLLVDDDLRHQMGEAARLRAVEGFSLDVLLGSIDSLYQEAASLGRRRRS